MGNYIKTMSTPYLVNFGRFVIGLTFLYSFGSKARDIRVFTDTVNDFGIFPAYYSLPISIIVLIAEALIPILSVLGKNYLAYSFLIAICLLVSFSLVISIPVCHNG